MLDLVQTLLLPVESLDSHQVEAVADQVRFDGHIQRRVTSQRRAEVDLEQPRFQV